METLKPEKNHGPPERKIHYVKNYYNRIALISQATPNNTHTLKDLTHNLLHSKTREQERKNNKILNVYFNWDALKPRSWTPFYRLEVLFTFHCSTDMGQILPRLFFYSSQNSQHRIQKQWPFSKIRVSVFRYPFPKVEFRSFAKDRCEHIVSLKNLYFLIIL